MSLAGRPVCQSPALCETRLAGPQLLVLNPKQIVRIPDTIMPWRPPRTRRGFRGNSIGMSNKKSANDPPQWLLRPKQKSDWALKLLHEKGCQIEELPPDSNGQPRFKVEGQPLTIAEIYQRVSKFPEWNDRLGLGTARLRRVKS